MNYVSQRTKLVAGQGIPNPAYVIKRAVKSSIVTLSLLCLICAAIPAHAELYKWVDKEGRVHYGDRIPPEYAAQEHEKFNDYGVPVQTQEKQLTPVELEARAAQEKLAQDKAAYDRQLLLSYEKISDIERLRETRLEEIRQQESITRNYLNGLEDRLAKLEKEASRYNYPYDPISEKPPMPDGLTAELMETVANIEEYQTALAATHREREDLTARFQKDIDRFQELKK